MSYLLTEIALEMLGYKFYDIYGVQDDINNFQNLAASERNTNEHNSSEPPLATLLGLNATTSSNDTKNARSGTYQSQNEAKDVIRIYLPESVTKLMDTEYNKVRQQLLRNKPSIATDSQMDAKATTQLMLQNLVETEHEKLRLEQKHLQSFRRHVEENLMDMNPTTFEKYCEAFKGTARSRPDFAKK